jgi:hypothetical protein
MGATNTKFNDRAGKLFFGYQLDIFGNLTERLFTAAGLQASKTCMTASSDEGALRLQLRRTGASLRVLCCGVVKSGDTPTQRIYLKV